MHPVVYISLTSIPSRATRILQENLDELLHQDYPFKKIIVTIPTVNMRGQVYSDDDKEKLAYVNDPKYKNKVVFHRPNVDYGPVMKYVGCLPHVLESDALIFVCDDDQKYAPTRISSLIKRWLQVDEASRPKTIVARKSDRMYVDKLAPSFTTLMGFRGLLVPKAAIEMLQKAIHDYGGSIPKCCSMNDDVFASIHFFQAGFKAETGDTEPSFVDGDTENKESVDSLHGSYSAHIKKIMDVARCNLQYNKSGCGMVTAVGIFSVVFLIFLIVFIIMLCRIKS